MAGLTTAESVATLDARFPTTGGGDYIGYSKNGTSEGTFLARTAVGATGWASATNADPSVKATANALVTAALTAALAADTVYYAIFSASTSGVQRTDWVALTDDSGTARTFTLAIGDKISHTAGKIAVTLT